MTLSTLCLSILSGIATAYAYGYAQGLPLQRWSPFAVWLIAGIAVAGHRLALIHVPLFGMALVGGWVIHLILLCRKTL